MIDSTEPPVGEPVHSDQENRYQFYHDPRSSDGLTETVVMAVADVADVDATDLKPLYEKIDPSGLETVVQPMTDGTLRSGAEVRFSLDGYTVEVHGAGHIVVHAPGDD